MARHVFVLLLVAVCLMQMSRGRPLTPEEGYLVLGVERRFLLEAADLLGRWRRGAADHLQLVREMRQLQAHHDHMMAAVATRLNWSSEAQPQTTHSGVTTEVAGALLVHEPRKFNQTPVGTRDDQEAQHLSAAGQSGWANDTLAGTTGDGPTAEVVDLLRLEAPSAEDMHQLADEFKRIWAQHKQRFDDVDMEADVSDGQ